MENKELVEMIISNPEILKTMDVEKDIIVKAIKLNSKVISAVENPTLEMLVFAASPKGL